jgi:hypothetical protein
MNRTPYIAPEQLDDYLGNIKPAAPVPEPPGAPDPAPAGKPEPAMSMENI